MLFSKYVIHPFLKGLGRTDEKNNLTLVLFKSKQLMRWKINDDGNVIDEQGTIMCMLPSKPDKFYSRLIKYAPQMYEAIVDYCMSMEQTSHQRNPKKQYEKFQELLVKLTDDD